MSAAPKALYDQAVYGGSTVEVVPLTRTTNAESRVTHNLAYEPS